MTIYDQAHGLARAIRESAEAQELARLKERAMEEDTNRTLLMEYKRLQARLQVSSMGGGEVPGDDMQRFQQLATLLYMNQDVQAYLLAEMRMHQMLGDVMKIISEAGGISLEHLMG